MVDWQEQDSLHIAVQENNLAQVKNLVVRGFPVSTFDDLGLTPLHYAARNENLEIAGFLLASGADINAQDETRAGNTPLSEVAGGCTFEMARLLVDAGADPTIPGSMRLTALHKAAKRLRGDGPRIYELLLKAAARFE